MVEYNTAMPKLEMREYGRNIQKLIEHCVTIPEREERTKFAYAIAEVMTQLFPELNVDETNQKVWDHINMISGFKLDIDFPGEMMSQDQLKPRPQRIPYSVKSDKYRFYGANLIKMIKEVGKMEGGVEKDKVIFLIANQMKKLLVAGNIDNSSDQRVFDDIREISGGGIDIDASTYRLNEYINVVAPQEGKKKKKK